MKSGAAPSAQVLRAFGLRATEMTPLPGNISQTAWRVGDLVVKLAQDPDETEWAAAIFDAIEEDGFRVHRPVPTRDGEWLFQNWTAWRWLDGEHERTRWREVVEASSALHAAIPRAAERAGRPTRPQWLDARTHRWARSENTVWHDAPMPDTAIYDVPEWELWERARAIGPPLTALQTRASQVIHGDVSGNVLASGSYPEIAFIDMSPGWRPVTSVEAQIAVEAVAWHGGDEALLEVVGARPDGRAEMARTVAFRVLCGFQAMAAGGPSDPGGFNPVETARFASVLDAIGA